MIKMLITVLFICIGLADTITITPTQTGVLTHNALCCGYNTYYDSGTSLQWIGDCNANYFGCVSSSLAGVWRWDISSLEGATINSAEIEFSVQGQYCSNGTDYGVGATTDNMNSSQALVLYNNAQQSGSIGTYGSIQVNSYVIKDALESGNLGVVSSTSSSCAMYMTGNGAPELTINYTPGVSYETGDVNMDGSVNVSDVVIAVNIVLGMSPFNELADINGDSIINVQDIILLVDIILNS